MAIPGSSRLIMLTGASPGSGKSTVKRALVERFRTLGRQAMDIDEDAVWGKRVLDSAPAPISLEPWSGPCGRGPVRFNRHAGRASDAPVTPSAVDDLAARCHNQEHERVRALAGWPTTDAEGREGEVVEAVWQALHQPMPDAGRDFNAVRHRPPEAPRPIH